MVAGGLHHIVESSFYTVQGTKTTALTFFFFLQGMKVK